MGYITVTNTFVTGTVFASGEMNTNYTDLINGTSDGTKDFNVEKAEAEGKLTVAGNSVVGTTNANKLYIYGRINTDLKINCHSLGSSSYAFKSIALDNGTTDGGTICFNGGLTSYIQMNSDGDILTIAGFSTGVKYTEDGYLRIGASSQGEMKIDSDDIEIRNQETDKDIILKANYGGTDTVFARSIVDKGIYETRERKENLNIIINGDMRIDQYDTYSASGTVAVSGNRFLADRFLMLGLGGVAYNKYIDSGYPNSQNNFPKYLGVACSTADTSLSATDYFVIQQIIEGHFIDPVMHKTCTLSFWVRSSKTGTYAVAFQNKGTGSNLPTSADRSYIDTYTINSANTWEYKTITVDLSSANSAGTWGTTNDIGLRIVWTLLGGTNFDTSAGSWQNGAYLKTNACVNNGDSTDNDFYLTGVQFTPTPFALPFQHRSIADEIELCQRYYEKSFNLDNAVYTTSTAGKFACYAQHVNYLYKIYDRYLTRKRDTVTATAYSAYSSATGYFSRNGGANPSVLCGAGNPGETGNRWSQEDTFTIGATYQYQGEFNSEF